METHAEIKDRCDGLECKLDELAADIREVKFDYKMVEKYTHIDEEIHQIYEWYEKMKTMILRYNQEKSAIEHRLTQLDYDTKILNNEVQNLKSRSYSQLF
jgi:septation ring formation regulator EzrA